MTYLFCLHLLKQKLKWFGLRTVVWDQFSDCALRLKVKTLVSAKDKLTYNLQKLQVRNNSVASVSGRALHLLHYRVKFEADI